MKALTGTWKEQLAAAREAIAPAPAPAEKKVPKVPDLMKQVERAGLRITLHALHTAPQPTVEVKAAPKKVEVEQHQKIEHTANWLTINLSQEIFNERIGVVGFKSRDEARKAVQKLRKAGYEMAGPIDVRNCAAQRRPNGHKMIYIGGIGSIPLFVKHLRDTNAKYTGE